MKPRSVYVHVPFCRHRCGYCNFTLVTDRDDLIGAYLDALEMEISTVLLVPQTVDTIFLGGGTPSYLLPADLERLLSIMSKWFIPSTEPEYSCEMNPLDCTADRLELLHNWGVNRISLGGQSFSDRKLKVLERDHTGEQLGAALAACRKDFSNVSLDLIFAAPNESLDEWRNDIQVAVNSPIDHLSTYGLTVERGSAFYGRALKHEISEIDSDLQLAMYEYAIDTLTRRGWDHYEVSSFSKTGFQCRHNEAYWLGEPWWGFGPGAASFVPNEADASVTRYVNHRSTTTYIRRVLGGRSPIAERDKLSQEQRLRERIVFGLRRLDGVNLDELAVHWGACIRPMFEPHLSRYIECGWLTLDRHSQLRLTRKGLVISDSLWPDLLAPGE